MAVTPKKERPESKRPAKLALHCLNCGTEILGRFCYHCGQESDVKLLTAPTLLRQVFKNTGKFDIEVRRTFYELAKRPGRFCRAYLRGKRKPFADPVKYFFISFVFQLVVFSAVKWVADNPQIDAAASIDKRTELLVLAASFFWALGYTAVFRRSKLNLAENLVCMLYFSAQTRVYSVILQLFALPLSAYIGLAHEIVVLAMLVAYLGYFYYATKQLYGEKWLPTLAKNIAVTLIFFGLFVPLFYLDVLIESFVGPIGKYAIPAIQ